jgi:aspartyl-tRNA(Asn)/glutamyl-tRNA(Gln) amidotransferase subunit A
MGEFAALATLSSRSLAPGALDTQPARRYFFARHGLGSPGGGRLTMTRRNVLLGLGAASAITAISPYVSALARAQSNGTNEMPGSIAAASSRIRDRQLSVTELTSAYLRSAKEFQPTLKAFITLAEDQALATARELDRELEQGRIRGPLHGIPIVYKDNFDTAGILTTMGSEFYSKRTASSDAEAVQRLKAAGTVMLGKTNMNEFAAGVAGRNKFYGDTPNPWDTTRWSGGSSSGTGVAVTAGLCLGGLGTDTGVSIRGPASWLGLVGVRPSYGRVSVRGTFPRAYTFDTVGPLTHTVEDAALLLTALAGFDPNDRYAVRSPQEDFTVGLNAGVRGVRLGIVDDFTYRNVTPEVGQAVQAAVDQLTKLGAQVKTVKVPLLSGKIDFRYPLTILLYEFNQIFGDTYRATANKEQFGPVVHANIAQGEKITREAYESALKLRPSEIAEIREVFKTVDVLLMPTHPFVAPPFSVDAEGNPGVRQFTVPISFTGFPAVSVPCGFSAEGLPIGLQVVANDFQERLIFRVAAAYERATEFHKRRPPMYTKVRL